jgi:hypothetical protein
MIPHRDRRTHHADAPEECTESRGIRHAYHALSNPRFILKIRRLDVRKKLCAKLLLFRGLVVNDGSNRAIQPQRDELINQSIRRYQWLVNR